MLENYNSLTKYPKGNNFFYTNKYIQNQKFNNKQNIFRNSNLYKYSNKSVYDNPNTNLKNNYPLSTRKKFGFDYTDNFPNYDKIPYNNNNYEIKIHTSKSCEKAKVSYKNNILDNYDKRIDYCLKKLNLENFRNIFKENNIGFNELLYTSQKDMNKIKIPKYAQLIIQKFSKDYLQMANLYTLEELKNFFELYYKKNLEYSSRTKINKTKINNNITRRNENLKKKFTNCSYKERGNYNSNCHNIKSYNNNVRNCLSESPKIKGKTKGYFNKRHNNKKQNQPKRQKNISYNQYFNNKENERVINSKIKYQTINNNPYNYYSNSTTRRNQNFSLNDYDIDNYIYSGISYLQNYGDIRYNNNEDNINKNKRPNNYISGGKNIINFNNFNFNNFKSNKEMNKNRKLESYDYSSNYHLNNEYDEKRGKNNNKRTKNNPINLHKINQNQFINQNLNSNNSNAVRSKTARGKNNVNKINHIVNYDNKKKQNLIINNDKNNLNIFYNSSKFINNNIYNFGKNSIPDNNVENNNIQLSDLVNIKDNNTNEKQKRMKEIIKKVNKQVKEKINYNQILLSQNKNSSNNILLQKYMAHKVNNSDCLHLVNKDDIPKKNSHKINLKERAKTTKQINQNHYSKLNNQRLDLKNKSSRRYNDYNFNNVNNINHYYSPKINYNELQLLNNFRLNAENNIPSENNDDYYINYL